MNESGAYFDAGCKAAIGVFKGFLKTEEFMKIGNELHEIRQKNASTKQINNISDMKVLTQDIQKWLGKVWFPKAVSTGLKHFAFVVPKDVLASMSMKAVNSNNNGIEIKYFDNEPSAKTWLNSK